MNRHDIFMAALMGNNDSTAKDYIKNKPDLTVYEIAPAIKSSLDATLEVNTEYYLGEVSTAALVLPTGAAGDKISIVLYSGTTPTTITVTGTYLGAIPTPEANQRIELNWLYDGTNWSVLSNVQAVSA